MKFYALLAFAFIASSFLGGSDRISFIANDMAAAREKAGREGKLIVASFGARWCQPCLMMEEGAWRSPDVIDFVESHFVALKVDIDNFDGMALRDKLNIEALPSTLILSSSGKILKKLEGSAGSAALLSFLQSYDAPEIRLQPQISPLLSELSPVESKEEGLAQQNFAPQDPALESVPMTEAPNASERIVNGSPKREALAPDIERKPAKPLAPESKPEPRIEAKPAPPIASAPGKKRVAPKPKTGYTVQIGVFAFPEKAEKMAHAQAKRFGKPAFLAESNLRGQRVLRALLGQFGSPEQAQEFRRRLRSVGIDALVKSWADVY